MPAVTVPATITFDFRGLAYYLTQNLAYRTMVKTKVDADIRAVIPDYYLISTVSSPFIVNEPASDASVEGFLENILDEINDGSSGGYFLELGTIDGIVYVWEGGIRYCLHTYRLQLDGEQWRVSDDKSPETFYDILITARWGTP